MSKRCAHLDAAADRNPAPGDPSGCQDCAAEGERAWGHLRLCTECGHVGCCDSSPRRHASTHHRRTGHPVVRSFEPGESWMWCYADEQLGH